MAIIYKSQAELEQMHIANQVVCRVLDAVEDAVKPGVSTGELGELAKQLIKRYEAEPAFLGYGEPPFPAVICTSVNEEVVHGIPKNDRILVEGDIISLDFGVKKNGFFGDSARTVAVGRVSERAHKLIEVTRESLERAMQVCKVGNRLGDISEAVQNHVEANGFSVVRAFVGHGIGRRMHEDPQVPNFVGPGSNPRLREGMVLAIEPMVNEGSYDVDIDPNDQWTARTSDKKLSAHFEHSVAITKQGAWVLSRL